MWLLFFPKSGHVNLLARFEFAFLSSEESSAALSQRDPIFPHHAVCALRWTVIILEEDTWSSWERTNCAPSSLWTTQLWNLSSNLRLTAWLLILITTSLCAPVMIIDLSLFTAHQGHILLTIPAWWWQSVSWQQDRAVLIYPFSPKVKRCD